MVDASHILDSRHVLEGPDGPLDNFDKSHFDVFAIRLPGAAARFSLRMEPDDANAIADISGFHLTQSINEFIEHKAPGGHDRYSARLGPNEWLLIAEGSNATETSGVITDQLQVVAHALIDVSHRNIAIEMTGKLARDVINTACPIDLASAAFPVGTATRTLFGKAEIVLARRADLEHQPVFRIECWRSFGRYVYAHLNDSAKLLGAN